MSKKSIEYARKKWSEACNLWVCLLCEQWERNDRNGYWIGGEVGGVWDMGGDVIMGMNDVIYAVEHNIPFQAYHDWQDYCMDVSELNIDTPSFIDYCNGIGVIKKENLDKLLSMKQDLDNYVNEEKKKLKER